MENHFALEMHRGMLSSSWMTVLAKLTGLPTRSGLLLTEQSLTTIVRNHYALEIHGGMLSEQLSVALNESLSDGCICRTEIDR